MQHSIHGGKRLRTWSTTLLVGMGSAMAAQAGVLPPPPVSPAPVTDYEYDANGNRVQVIKARSLGGFATSSTFDSRDRLRTSTDARNGVTTLEYDGRDQLQQVSDPRQLLTSYSRNGLGDLVQLSSPDTGSAHSTYDAAGRLLTRMDSRGVQASIGYDALSRVTSVVYSQSGHAELRHSWTYDQVGEDFGHGVGQLTSSKGTDNQTRHGYDAHGRLSTHIQTMDTATLTTRYSYDAAGKLTRIIYPSGRMLVLDYEHGRPVRMGVAASETSPVQPLISEIQWEPFGAVRSWRMHLANGPGLQERVHDEFGRLVRYPLHAWIRDLSYDAADRVVSYTHLDAGNGQLTPEAQALNQSFAYDELDRLTGITTPTDAWTLTYDANGNRTGITHNGSMRGYSIAASSNRLEQISNPARSLTYDAAGNTISDSATPAPGYTAIYRLDNRLGSLTRAGTTTHYSYNPQGQRIRKQSVAGSTHYVYAMTGQLLGEYSGATPSQEFVWLGDVPVAVLHGAARDAEVFFVYADHLNTPRVLIDQAAQTRWRWVGEPFGSHAAEPAPAGLPPVVFNLRFPGQYFDLESGLHYNYFRDYDAGSGRYVQSDPIGLEGGINSYAYVGGNPLSSIDPNGLARIIGAPAYGPNFGNPSNEYQEWQKRYGQPMQRIMDAVQNRIRGLCQIDRDRLQKEFDEWVLAVDPNIENPARRIQQGYGITKGNKTTFSRRFFMIEPGENPSQLHVGWHEFRHTMPGNASIIDPPGSIGDILSGNAERVPSERDADAFADWLIHSSKNCGCPK
ncbi:RHS repeat domain-containing protein [Pelomonas sp. CA6]|uniref:RHS repeat domain-containing protein n=1 Tax=Pelomonas sp. CA6 TaxID=2907999 RepID=UPI0024087C0E|nr:RHS repeat-associated core domain-containing protein [Pelomonas sp. CA6]